MRSSYFFIPVFLWIASFASSQSIAQDGLEEFIERDSAAFIVIQDPAAILEQIESSTYFKNRHFQRAMELLVEGDFPLTNRERLEELEEKWNEVRELLVRFDEVSLIVHSWADGAWAVPKVSIAFTGPDESIQDAKDLYAKIESFVVDSKTDEPGFFSLMAGGEFQSISLQKSNNLILLSNAPEKSQQLMDRLEQSDDKKFRSLARYRSYLRVQKLLEKRAKSPQVRGFLAPKSFWRLIASLVAGDQTIMIEPPKSIAAMGFQVLLESDRKAIATPDGNYQPVISWDFVLTYTMPASGFGKLIESFEPFEEFPSLPFSITSLKALGFDLNAKHDAAKEIYEKYQKHLFAPGLGFQKYFNFSEFGVTFSDPDTKSMLESTNGIISVYHEGNPRFWQPAMVIRKVNDREAMEKLLANRLKAENRSAAKAELLVEIPNDHGQLFGRTDLGIREQLGRQAKSWGESGDEMPKELVPKEGEPLNEAIMSNQFEYFINDDWMIHGDHNSMRQFLSTVYEAPSGPRTFDLLLEATMNSSGQTSFFKVDYQSNEFYKVENKRRQNSFESARIREKYGTGSDDQSPEVWKKLMSEPNEYGLRNKIESTEDTTAAVQQLIVHAYNDTFGTVVSLYSREDHKMRIFGQIYSLVDE